MGHAVLKSSCQRNNDPEADVTDMLESLSDKLDNAVVDDPTTGTFRTNRRIFTDEEIFELEMKHIFEGNWIYLAHESQIPAPGDYLTTYMGRQPIVITRSKDGKLNCLINACAHRGAMLCRRKTDNRPTLTCPFHGWTFRNDGTLLKVKDPDDAGYPENFNTEGSHNLTKVAKFESYRGFLFGSLNPDVTSLDEHLGDATKVIDMLVDQSPDGLEVLRGSSTYTYDGNWKVQAENGADGYHVTAVHWNYAATTSRRNTGESKNTTKTLDAGSWGSPAAATGRIRTVISACGRGPATRRTGRCGTGWTS
ncbi:Rieske 2Fe-2S domain-containing protein [Flexivirga alba]|uniref:Rieske 2Fe-2S domain-containing protein n=1 Tax=Flexivirga alba TaxID=702742 RepID=A0ABW2AIA0_9MICO